MKMKALFHAAIVLLGSVTECKNVLVDSLTAAPDGWTKTGDVNGDKLIKLRIALEQPNLEEFERILYSVSTPHHPIYGRHLSRESVKELVKPAEESATVVLNWLRSAGIHEEDIEDDGDWINFRTKISKASEMLNTTFGAYRHVGTVKQHIRTLQ
jgi:tripeptidyl-peptidase I